MRRSVSLVSVKPASKRARQEAFPRRLFCQELAVLLDAGIPLYEALITLREKESSTSVAHVLDTLTTALSQGKTLSQGMRMQPSAFSSLLIASIEASQRTGQTAQALRQHAAYLAWLDGLRDKLISAAIYPAILIGASTLVIAFLTVFVVPRFAEIYEDMGGDLPWMSAVLLDVGRGVGAHPWLAIGGLLGLMAGIWAAWTSPVTRALVSAQLWRTPVIGPRLRLIELASLYRTLGLLLQAGVAVVPALEASAELVGPSLRGQLEQATRRVREGVRLSESLHQNDLSTPVSLRMVRVGEQTGELGSMLERAATFYDEELARFTEWVGKVVSPVLMLIMGVLIGGIVVLMYLPIFQVAEQIQ
ncbi:MAG TPA: type II secretion system F family protein [Aquabacterium sp.]|uniref:type II secretion system F family protein n=1 Tax=Aquabacterium sp. TaxID=1872578 RepID=UPI002E3207B4|nr:type II secretion system F family protein [Aquabacterium sp.]HEX5357274.1 type II secretion system F family protein [Aquabacterium sp.]